MKNTILLLLLIPFAYFLRAQDGVYLTYEDFKAEKVQASDDRKFDYNFGTNGYASIKANGQKTKWKLSEIWGFRKGRSGWGSRDTRWRALHCKDCKDGAARIEAAGNYVFYVATIEVSHASGNGGSRDHYYISKDLNSPVYEFTAHLESLDDIVAAHKDEFKELAPYLKKTKKGEQAEEVLIDCITHSKEYKPEPGVQE